MELNPKLLAAVKRQEYPMVFVTVSGAHLYGFASSDSDYDLRGVHVLPIRDVVGLEEPICKACDWSISYPTSEFIFDIEFPENYEISKYACDVRMVLANLNAENELKRLREGNMFSVEKIIDKWTMSLRVAKPLQDHAYYIYYMPPRVADLHGLP